MGEVKCNWVNMESGWVINCYWRRHWRRMTILLKSKEGLIPFQFANNPSTSERWQETGSWTKNRELKLNPCRMKHWWERFWRIKRYCSHFPLVYYLFLSNQWKDYVISLSQNITFPLLFTMKLGLTFPDKTWCRNPQISSSRFNHSNPCFLHHGFRLFTGLKTSDPSSRLHLAPSLLTKLPKNWWIKYQWW